MGVFLGLVDLSFFFLSLFFSRGVDLEKEAGRGGDGAFFVCLIVSCLTACLTVGFGCVDAMDCLID